MLMKMNNDTILLKDVSEAQYSVIRSWNRFKFDKKTKIIEGPADMDTLDRLSRMVKLPASIEAYRAKLHRVQDAIDAERKNESPVPFYPYPVKVSLFRHQQRGANMALLAFGWADPAPVKGVSARC